MAKRGRSFVNAEESQLCFSHLHISQDPCTGIGQKKEAFWGRVHAHYNQHRPAGMDSRTQKSLEGKWSDIKHDVSKFIGCYYSVDQLNISGANEADVEKKALEYYQSRHPKGLEFTYKHCWLILRDVPRWADPPCLESTKKKKQKFQERQQSVGAGPSVASTIKICDSGLSEADSVLQRPGGVKSAKAAQKEEKVGEMAGKAQARAGLELAAVGREKVQLLRDAHALNLFSVDETKFADSGAQQYIRLRRKQELHCLKQQVKGKGTNSNPSFQADLPAYCPYDSDEEVEHVDPKEPEDNGTWGRPEGSFFSETPPICTRAPLPTPTPGPILEPLEEGLLDSPARTDYNPDSDYESDRSWT